MNTADGVASPVQQEIFFANYVAQSHCRLIMAKMLQSVTLAIFLTVSHAAGGLAESNRSDPVTQNQEAYVAYRNGDYVKALALWRPLALRGNAMAQYYIGLMTYYGQGVPKNFLNAANWFRRVAEHGDPHGQVALGMMYSQGKGVSRNYVEAFKWLDLAASQSGTEAQKLRDELAQKMTPAQIAEAKRLAAEWKPTK